MHDQPTGLCECGCGQQTRLAPQSNTGKGWVKGQPLRYARGHARKPKDLGYDVQDRGYETPCWVWRHSTDTDGYAIRKFEGRSRPVHRVYYEQANGPVPAGLVLDHLCRVRRCVNPDHLDPVTDAINVQRGSTARLNWEAVHAIRASTEPVAVLAARYGVALNTIDRAKHGRTWKT